MLKISQTRLLAAALGCLAIAATSIALAQDQQSGTQSNQTQPATQSSPPSGLQLDAAGSQLDPAGTAQQKSSDQASQPSSPSSEQSSVLKSASDSQSSADAQKSNKSDAQKSRSSGNASGNRDWPAPQRYNPNNPQGGSIGVSISADGQGIVISRVHSGTPAQQMGLRPRDRITSVNGQQVSNSDQFISIIRNMNAGDEVELGIVRDEAPSTLKGKLEAYSQALARTPEASAGNAGGMGRSRGMRGRITDDMGSNVQTSYEERSQSGRQASGDIESRLTNLEQQMSQLRQDVAEIRVAVRSNSPGSTSLTSPTSGAPGTQPAAGAIQPGQSGPRTPSVFPPTPGQPPSVQRNAGQPATR